MKKLLLILGSFLVVWVSNAQSKKYNTSRDYPISDNLDSLSKVAESKKNNPYEYLHALVILERNRRYIESPDFGKDFDKINQLGSKLKPELALAQYYFLKGFKSFQQGKNRQAYDFYVKSNQNFEKIKDTTGLIAINRALSDLYSSTEPNLAKSYFKKAIILAKESSSPIDKIAYFNFIIVRHKLLDTLPNAKQVISAFQKSIQIIDKHPEFETHRKLVYTLVQTGLSELNENQLALKYAFEALAYNESKKFYHYIIYFNLGILLCRIGKYEKGLKYIKKSNELFIKTKANTPMNHYNLYNTLQDAQYHVGKYKDAYETSLAKDSVKKIIDENYQKITLADITAKYESEKKEALIKNLELEKEVSTHRNWLFFGGLIITIIGLSGVSYLAWKLKKSNTNLEILHRERDKLYTIIAHDLKSPINTFQNLSDIMSFMLKKKQFDKLDTLMHQVEIVGLSLGSLLNNLLNWSITLQSEVQTKPSNINIRKYLDDLLPIYRKMAELKSIELNEELIDYNLNIDPNSLSVIIRNLLDNAIKYSKVGGNIELKTQKNENQFVFEVVNSSENINDFQLKKIKELFEGTKKYTFGEAGLGIGMILAKQYADICKAQIVFKYDTTKKVSTSIILRNQTMKF